MSVYVTIPFARRPTTLFHPPRDSETLEPRQRRQRDTTTNIVELLKARDDIERGGGVKREEVRVGFRAHVFELLTLIRKP